MDDSVAPVIAGLAVGIALIVIFITINANSNYKIVPTQYKISQEQAIETATHDLTTKYIKNPENIKVYTIVGNQDAEYIPVQNLSKRNWALQPLIFAHPNGTIYLVNATTGDIQQCHDPYCPLPNQAIKTIEGRLGWIVELVARCGNYPNNGYDVMYVIDAINDV